MSYELTDKEIDAINKYQLNNFKIMNSLLRKGIENEINISRRSKQGYPYLTKDMLINSLMDIQNLYSAILKRYIASGMIKPDKQLYRGTHNSLVKQMNGEISAFNSASININQTLSFSRKYINGQPDDSDRAIFLVEANVPWLNIEQELGGGEEEFIFVPAKMTIQQHEITANKKYGEEYKLTLSEINIIEKSTEELDNMLEEILNRAEKMSDYLKYILLVIDNPNFAANPRTLMVIREYEEWKDLVIEYNHQQYLLIKKTLLGAQYSENTQMTTKAEEKDISDDEALSMRL